MKIKIGEAISKGTRILKENPLIFLPASIAAISQSIFPYFMIGVYPPEKTPSSLQELIGILLGGKFLLGLFLIALIGVFVWCIIVRMVYDATQGEISFFKGIEVAIRKFIPVLIATLLWGLISAIGAIFFLLPGIFFAIKLFFYAYIILIEGEGIFGSLSKSWQIVKGNWWRLFGFLFLFGIIIMVLASIFSLLPRSVQSLTDFLLVLLSYSWFPSVFVIAYLQLRSPEVENENV